MRNKILFVLSITLFLIFQLLFSLPNKAQTTNTTPKIGKARISVFDNNNTPIENASIKVIETMEVFSTNKVGIATLSLLTNESNQLNKYSSPPKTWTEFTLLIQAPGFYPHILFGLKLTPNTNRIGIVITLKNRIEDNQTPFTTSYDFPPEDWINELLRKEKAMDV